MKDPTEIRESLLEKIGRLVDEAEYELRQYQERK